MQRLVKQQITLRIDADVIDWFRAQALEGRGCQTNIDQTHREHVRRSTCSTLCGRRWAPSRLGVDKTPHLWLSLRGCFADYRYE